MPPVTKPASEALPSMGGSSNLQETDSGQPGGGRAGSVPAAGSAGANPLNPPQDPAESGLSLPGETRSDRPPRQGGAVTASGAIPGGAQGGAPTTDPSGQGALGGASGPSLSSDGQGIRRLPTGGERIDDPVWREEDEIVRQLQYMLEQESLAPELMTALGANREALKDFVDDYWEAVEQERERKSEEAAHAPEEPAVGVLLGGAAAAEAGLEAGDAMSHEVTRDVLRSRFEGARDRLSHRYRDAVDRYYQALAEEQ
jgi:hypothetical protein